MPGNSAIQKDNLLDIVCSVPWLHCGWVKVLHATYV